MESEHRSGLLFATDGSERKRAPFARSSAYESFVVYSELYARAFPPARARYRHRRERAGPSIAAGSTSTSSPATVPGASQPAPGAERGTRRKAARRFPLSAFPSTSRRDTFSAATAMPRRRPLPTARCISATTPNAATPTSCVSIPVAIRSTGPNFCLIESEALPRSGHGRSLTIPYRSTSVATRSVRRTILDRRRRSVRY